MEENTMETQEKKKVFVAVPIEKNGEPLIERAIQIAKADYCKVRGVSPKDVIFYDYLRDLKHRETENDPETEELKKLIKHEGLDDVGWIISMLGIVDEVILGINWTKSRSCKVIARSAEVYMIPHIRMMKGNKKAEIEENEKTLEYRKKHHIDVIWKE
jgi:hypothetical protein